MTTEDKTPFGTQEENVSQEPFGTQEGQTVQEPLEHKRRNKLFKNFWSTKRTNCSATS